MWLVVLVASLCLGGTVGRTTTSQLDYDLTVETVKLSYEGSELTSPGTSDLHVTLFTEYV